MNARSVFAFSLTPVTKAPVQDATLESRSARAVKLVECLSRRETQVLEALVDGLTNKGIARTLGISPRTVEIHRGNMLTKLGVQSSQAAACIGVLAGMGACEYLNVQPRQMREKQLTAASE